MPVALTTANDSMPGFFCIQQKASTWITARGHTKPISSTGRLSASEEFSEMYRTGAPPGPYRPFEKKTNRLKRQANNNISAPVTSVVGLLCGFK